MARWVSSVTGITMAEPGTTLVGEVRKRSSVPASQVRPEVLSAAYSQSRCSRNDDRTPRLGSDPGRRRCHRGSALWHNAHWARNTALPAVASAPKTGAAHTSAVSTAAVVMDRISVVPLRRVEVRFGKIMRSSAELGSVAASILPRRGVVQSRGQSHEGWAPGEIYSAPVEEPRRTREPINIKLKGIRGDSVVVSNLGRISPTNPFRHYDLVHHLPRNSFRSMVLLLRHTPRASRMDEHDLAFHVAGRQEGSKLLPRPTTAESA